MCLFCGGKKCKHEDYLKHSNPAIVGLNCDQIDQNIFASQRPSNTLINDFNLIDQFKEKGIGLIINVQRPGEHPYCGPNGGLDLESGFTYTPSLFTSEDIQVKLCGWKDMNVPDSLTFMLDIVKEMHHFITKLNKKVLVHCHAGYGRTGIVIACYKIFSECLSSDEAIKELRAVRSKCVQTSSQQQYCRTFHQFITQMKEVFRHSKGDVKLFIQYQNSLSIESTARPFVPRMLTEAFNAITKLKKDNKIPLDTIYKALNGSLPYSDKMDSCLQVIIDSINRGNWESMMSSGDIVLIAELLYVWFDESVKCVINPNRINKLFNEETTKSCLSFEKKEGSCFFSVSAKEEMRKALQRCLRRYEYDTLLYIAEFIEMIKLDKGEEEGDKENVYEEEERLMIEKLSTFLLGFNIKFLHDKSNNPKEHYATIQKLNQLIEYLRRTEGLKANDIRIKSQLTYSQQSIPLNKRSQMIQSIDLNKRIDEEQEEELFDYYLRLQEHFENQSDALRLKGDNQTVKTQSDNYNHNPNHIVRDYTMKNDVFKASVIDNESSTTNQPNANDKESYRNRIRTTKQLKLSQFDGKEVKSNKGKDSKPKKLWIKEEDC